LQNRTRVSIGVNFNEGNYEVRHDMKKKLRKDKVEFISSE